MGNILKRYGEWGINLRCRNKSKAQHSLNVKMTDSIRMKFIMILLYIIGGTFLVYLLLNNLFLEDFYMNSKKDNFMDAYEQMNDIVSSEDENYRITSSAQNKLSEICENYGIAVVIIGTNNSIVYQYGNGAELSNRLTMIDFGLGSDNVSIIKKTDKYIFQRYSVGEENYGYLELYGRFTNRRLFLMRTTVESIQESASLSRIFFLYVGIAVLFISVIIVYFVSEKFTRPILDLANLSERMSNFDFNVKYVSDSDDEIAVLGNSMNKLSDKLKQNILELKTANNQLKQDIAHKEEIDEMRKDFISNVSHELKTPIALIQGYAEGLHECINDDAESREFYCEVIIDEAEKMNKLVKNLLMLNQLEFGKSQPQFERFNVVMLIKGVLSALDVLMKQNDIQLIFDETQDIYVYADEFQIEGVVTNYLTNAIHYSSGRKEIKINIDKMDSQVRINVFNSGNCIPEEELEKIWVKFYKIDKARMREYGGSGIGLSIVKAIMNTHNQNCGVENEEDGVQFWFELDAELA